MSRDPLQQQSILAPRALSPNSILGILRLLNRSPTNNTDAEQWSIADAATSAAAAEKMSAPGSDPRGAKRDGAVGGSGKRANKKQPDQPVSRSSTINARPNLNSAAASAGQTSDTQQQRRGWHSGVKRITSNTHLSARLEQQSDPVVNTQRGS